MEQLSELTQYMYVCVCIYTPSGFCLSGEPSLTQTLMTIEHLLCASQEARCSCLQCVPLVLQVLRRYKSRLVLQVPRRGVLGSEKCTGRWQGGWLELTWSSNCPNSSTAPQSRTLGCCSQECGGRDRICRKVLGKLLKVPVEPQMETGSPRVFLVRTVGGGYTESLT